MSRYLLRDLRPGDTRDIGGRTLVVLAQRPGSYSDRFGRCLDALEARWADDDTSSGLVPYGREGFTDDAHTAASPVLELTDDTADALECSCPLAYCRAPRGLPCAQHSPGLALVHRTRFLHALEPVERPGAGDTDRDDPWS